MKVNLEAEFRIKGESADVLERQRLWDACLPATTCSQPFRARGLDPEAVERMDVVRVATEDVADIMTMGDSPLFRSLEAGDLLFKTVDGLGFHRGWRKVNWDRSAPSAWSKRRAPLGYDGKPSPVSNKILRNGVKSVSPEGDARAVFFCEGEADFLSMAQAMEGEAVVIGLASGSWTEEIALCMIHPESLIYLMFDSDLGGEHYRKTVCNSMPRHKFRNLFIPPQWTRRVNHILGRPEDKRADINDLLRAGALRASNLDFITFQFSPPKEWKDYDDRPAWLRGTRKQRDQVGERTAEQIRAHFEEYASIVRSGLEGNRFEALRVFGHLYGMVARAEIDEAEVDNIAHDHYIRTGKDRETRGSRGELVRSCKRHVGLR
jgi:5S rRNA maturation endonuclease (ribonuclease M5)